MMKRKIRERCGVFGIISTNPNYSVAKMIYSGLIAIQHRGQLYSGMAIVNHKGELRNYKGRGLVSKVLNPKRLRLLSGNVGIGHVCYGKPNCLHEEDAQPYYFKISDLELALALNGAIINHDDLMITLKNLGRIITSGSDIELIAVLIETLFSQFNDMDECLKELIKMLEGAYSLLILTNNGHIYAIRDPTGCKPLCYGMLEINDMKFYIFSSESCSLDVLGAKLIDDVKPGEIIKIHPEKEIQKFFIKSNERVGVCHFEYVYFARPDSIIDGISVGETRFRLGMNLAKDDDLNISNAVVVPVPDSGRSAAMGYSWYSGIPYEEGLMKNRYIWQLKANPKEKLNPIKSVVNGKNIILVDDSILSGETMKDIIGMLREAGAKSIHVRISCPPIIKSCKLNDLFSNRDLLIAYQTKIQDYDHFNSLMQEYIEADSLKFQTIESLIDAIQLNENRICLYCLREFCFVDEKIER